MKKIICALVACVAAVQLFAADKKEVLLSPDGKLKVEVALSNQIVYTLQCDGKNIVVNSPISMTLRGKGVLGEDPKLSGVKRTSLQEKIEAPFHRNPSFNTSYNQLELKFKGGYGVIFRAYDEGMAYRFFTTLKDSMIVEDERATFGFDKDYKAYVPFPKGKGNTLISEFPGLPSVTKDDDVRCEEEVVERHDYIAKVNGTRTYPWRVLAVTTNDAQMLTNNLVYALASPNRIGDTSWIKPVG